MKEEWRDIKGYEGFYQVSNLGRVKSLERKVASKNGSTRVIKARILKPQINLGYYHVGLFIKGKGKIMRVHKLVAVSFLNHTPCGFKEVIDHINGKTLDNRVGNLELVSQRENTHRYHNSNKKASKHICVYPEKNKWMSSIYVNRRRIRLGVFDTETEANLYYRQALKCVNEGRVSDIKVKKPKTTSKYKGVCLDKRRNTWASRINIDGKRVYLGAFNTEEEACKAIQEKLKAISS